MTQIAKVIRINSEDTVETIESALNEWLKQGYELVGIFLVAPFIYAVFTKTFTR